MARFAGFQGGKSRVTRLPSAFFTDLLPEIDHLDELKVTLYAFWFLDRLEGDLRFIRHSDFAGDAWLLEGLGNSNTDTVKALADALEQAVQRGSLLRAYNPPAARWTRRYIFSTRRVGRHPLPRWKKVNGRRKMCRIPNRRSRWSAPTSTGCMSRISARSPR